MPTLTFTAIRAKQSEGHQVVCFSASAAEILQFATIERIKRDGNGQLSGFQRPQIAAHIQEIKEYLSREDAVLPNPIVVAFTDSVTLTELSDNLVQIEIHAENGPAGLVVDGQQRLSALKLLGATKDFQIFVSALICINEAELRQQFVLINNTRPLSKSLIYELLPTVDGLPNRFSSRSFAAELTSRLNHDTTSSLKGMIKQHTNPGGVISDTAIQKVIMNSLNDGIIREFVVESDGKEKSFRIISEFYKACQLVFKDSWTNHKPKTSRLVHGAGIIAMGYIMEMLAVNQGLRTWEDFQKGLAPMLGKTAWTSGIWEFATDDIRPWNAIQNTPNDILTLTHFLMRTMREAMRTRHPIT